jgi:hypothetical protein
MSDSNENTAVLEIPDSFSPESNRPDPVFDEPEDNGPIFMMPAVLDWREVSAWR